jgi:addiction module RelE/StbE family toxin
MENTYKLIWSDEALQNLKSIIAYLEARWTDREIKKFARLLDRNLELIIENPQIFPKSGHSNEFRRSVISKQVSLYYRVEDQIIHIVSVFDNRQNPNRLK